MKYENGMRLARTNRSPRRKPATVSPLPSQIPQGLSWHQTQNSALRYRRLTS